jgi:hypothetical protein
VDCGHSGLSRCRAVLKSENFGGPAIELNDHFGATVAQSGERLANARRSVAETDVPEPPAGVAEFYNRLCSSVLTKARLLVTVALDMDCWPRSAGAKVAGGIRTRSTTESV